MKIKIYLFVFLLALSQSAFSQEDTAIQTAIQNAPKAYLFSSSKLNVTTAATETAPKAFLFSSGNLNPVSSITETAPKAYLFSSSGNNPIFTRPRIYVAVAEKENNAEIAKAVTAFDLERKAFELINQKRQMMNLQPLIWSEDVAKIARLHSVNMANYKFFSHSGLDGSMVNNRADACGLKKWRAIGENIAYNQGFENPVEFAVERWMQSPAHRENLLDSRWKESGIGIAITADGTYYFTEVFLERK